MHFIEQSDRDVKSTKIIKKEEENKKEYWKFILKQFPSYCWSEHFIEMIKNKLFENRMALSTPYEYKAVAI